jgi:hypothetical protein
LYHFNPSGFLALLALGLFFGYAAYKTGSILVPVILHFLNNFISIGAYLLYGKEDVLSSETYTSETLLSFLAFFVISVLAFAGYMYFLNQYYKGKEERAAISGE